MLRRSLILLPVLLAACGRGGDGASVAAPDPTTTTAPPTLTAMVDWDARTISVDGDVPVDVRFCDGDAPLLCVNDDGTILGVIELASFPEAVSDFHAWASSFYDSIASDRVVGCDPTYTLDGEPPVVAFLAGAVGVRYGFVGSADGRPIERVVGYAINDDGALQLLVANALADDACLSRESELPLDVMDELEPLLSAIAEGSSF